MSLIPEEYQITNLINQDTYLVNGELKKWTGQTTPVFSTISSTEKYTPTLLGSIPFMADKEAAEVVEAANAAYNKGQGFIYEIEELDKNKNYYVYCRSGARSAKACQIMNELGINNAYNLLGGILDWEGDTVNP